MFDTAQMPVNLMAAHFRSFSKLVLPEAQKMSVGTFGEGSIGIVESNDLVGLEQIQVVSFEAPGGLIDLPGCGFLGSAFKLRHQAHFFPIAVSKRSTRARPKSCPETLSPALQLVG